MSHNIFANFPLVNRSTSRLCVTSAFFCQCHRISQSCMQVHLLTMVRLILHFQIIRRGVDMQNPCNGFSVNRTSNMHCNSKYARFKRNWLTAGVTYLPLARKVWIASSRISQFFTENHEFTEVQHSSFNLE